MLQFVTLFYFQEIFIRKNEYIFVMKEKIQNLKVKHYMFFPGLILIFNRKISHIPQYDSKSPHGLLLSLF